MKTSFLIILIYLITFSSCTKSVESAPQTSGVSNPVSFKTYSILTIGDSIKNVTSFLPFTTSPVNYLNLLNPSEASVQCNVQWYQISETGQQIEMGSVAQTTTDIAFALQNATTPKAVTMLQFQNKETDHYEDGTSTELLKGPQYYSIVKIQ